MIKLQNNGKIYCSIEKNRTFTFQAITIYNHVFQNNQISKAKLHLQIKPSIR